MLLRYTGNRWDVRADRCCAIPSLHKRNSMNLFDYPIVLCGVLLLAFWLSAIAGSMWASLRPISDAEREDFRLIEAATLTLLGLIIGFSFSMATGRYDQRKNYEEAEANAIGTEFVRADLLPAADTVRVHELLKHYLDLRIAFYQTRSPRDLRQIDAATIQSQTQLWQAVQSPALAQPTPVTALAVAGMNDVLNSQGHTQAAWWNRLPAAAWALMIVIAICCNISVGYGMRGRRGKAALLLVLPTFVSFALLLIADIDSPRGGFIRVPPENLISLAHSLPQS
jgi:cytochrome bd-type quinol oxidase subunit 2